MSRSQNQSDQFVVESEINNTVVVPVSNSIHQDEQRKKRRRGIGCERQEVELISKMKLAIGEDDSIIPFEVNPFEELPSPGALFPLLFRVLFTIARISTLCSISIIVLIYFLNLLSQKTNDDKDIMFLLGSSYTLCSVSWGVILVSQSVRGTGSSVSRYIYITFVTAFAPSVCLIGIYVVLYVFETSKLARKLLLIVLLILGSAGGAALCEYMFVKIIRTHPIFIASQNAKGASPKLSKWHAKRRVGIWKRSLLNGVPIFFILGVLLIYVFGIMELNRNVSGFISMSVYCLALLIKVAGSKYIIRIMTAMRTGRYYFDAIVFVFEYVTSLLLRVMMLSTSVEATSQTSAIINSLVELMVRNFLYNSYVVQGHGFPGWDSDRKKRFYFFGRGRVVDAGNDMIAEYVTSFTAASVLLFLGPTNVFNLVNDPAIDLTRMVRVVTFQAVPNVLVDVYISYLETSGGLLHHFETFWVHVQLSVVLTKIFSVVFLTVLVLVVLVKSQDV